MTRQTDRETSNQPTGQTREHVVKIRRTQMKRWFTNRHNNLVLTIKTVRNSFSWRFLTSPFEMNIIHIFLKRFSNTRRQRESTAPPPRIMNTPARLWSPSPEGALAGFAVFLGHSLRWSHHFSRSFSITPFSRSWIARSTRTVRGFYRAAQEAKYTNKRNSYFGADHLTFS